MIKEFFKMKLLTKSIKNLAKYKPQRKYSTTPAYIYPSEDDNYTSRPEYPQIDLVHPESDEGKKEKWFNKIKRQLTVEEKLFEVNVQRRWGWKCFMIHEGVIPYNNLVFAQHMTKSHIIETETLPGPYKSNSEKCRALCNEIKNDVIDAVEYQLNIRRYQPSQNLKPSECEKKITQYVVTELNRILMNSLWSSEPHLKNLQVDYSPRIEASWKIESMVETFVRKKGHYQIPLEEIPEEYLDRPSDKFIQYIGHPILQLRCKHPLPEIIDVSEALLLEYSVPLYEYDPHLVLGYEMERRYLNNIPGFWPGEEREFSFVSYHDCHNLKNRPPTYGAEDAKEALYSQILFASFGWLMPLACYQGFSSFHDLTYPLVTQTILTDGKEFTFAAYQLNTTELHWENLFKNLKTNICWITPTKPLYESFENGKIKGFNEEVLQSLIQFYINTPKPLENVQMKPYLGDKIKHIADYEDDEKVLWLQEKFKQCCSNRKWHGLNNLYEVQDWERIYKIMFPSRPRDPRRRPFELKQNPFLEKLTFEEYIPKELRPDKNLPKWKQRKYRRTFFPQ